MGEKPPLDSTRSRPAEDGVGESTSRFRRLASSLFSVPYRDVKAAEAAEKKKRKGRPAKARRPSKA